MTYYSCVTPYIRDAGEWTIERQQGERCYTIIPLSLASLRFSHLPPHVHMIPCQKDHTWARMDNRDKTEQIGLSFEIFGIRPRANYT